MSDFKVGDVVFYMNGLYGEMSPSDLEIGKAVIKRECDIDDTLYCTDGICIRKDRVYSSKQDCLDAFKRRLDEL